MVLYNKHLDFPKKLNPTRFLIWVTLFYVIFCVDPNQLFADKSFEAKLFFNDFNESGYLAWFINTLYLYGFLFIAFRGACVMIQHRLIKSIFYALYIDSVISFVNTLIFGYYNPVTSIIIRNVSIIIAMLYSYFILYNATDDRTT